MGVTGLGQDIDLSVPERTLLEKNRKKSRSRPSGRKRIKERGKGQKTIRGAME